MKVFKCPRDASTEDCEGCPGLEEAVDALIEGGLVVYPTDTVYGLAVAIHEAEAIDRLFQVKGRPGSDPIPVAVSSFDEIQGLAHVPKALIDVLKGLEDQPITWVLPAREGMSERLLAGGRSIGIRVMNKGCAARLIRSTGAITTTSANAHGQPPPTTVQEAIDQLGDAVAVYIDCGPTLHKVPTTVVAVDLDTEPHQNLDNVGVRIIRQGAVKGALVEEHLMTGLKKVRG